MYVPQQEAVPPGCAGPATQIKEVLLWAGVSEPAHTAQALKRLDADPRIGLIVTDYLMPTLNGIDLCRKLEADPRFRRIPVILMSATYISSETLPAQISAVFGKPLLFEKLISKVQEILGAVARGPELT